MKKLILALMLCHPLHWVALGVGAWLYPEPPLPSITAKIATMAMVDPDPELLWVEMDADLLADVAMGEDPDALAAIMHVVLNRRQGDEPLEYTIQNGRAFGTRRAGRFYPAWSRTPGARWARFYPGQWANAQGVAWRVLLGLQGDPTGGADHFHRRGTWTPSWAPQDSTWVLVGSHFFYLVPA